ncbi:hypothetical protein [Aliarcobacter butzleri]|uniref:Lipoprotein n=1 Tax=Aliarcobacter butzleri TaxID=28197 RepID=A0AAW6VF17_9BACT|nr:hypothetical protein [Aliarcobacter butzleri]MDK2041300.1 hypothetical protein [Aliarcobacter butzleri]MDK2096275.1 hypothetical protein [Aliarcobacter butzleri]
MYKKIFISLLFIMTIFNGCGTKNNIVKKEDYKILDEVSIIGSSRGSVTFSKYSTTFYKCKIMKESYDKEILDVSPIKKLLQEKNVKIKYIEPTKKILIIKIEKYLSEFNNNCKPNKIDIKIELYDVEDISKNWNKDNMKNYIKALDDKRLIYSQSFILDENYNNYSELSYRVRGLVIIDNKDKKDINKFYQEVIKDLEKVMKFPQ